MTLALRAAACLALGLVPSLSVVARTDTRHAPQDESPDGRAELEAAFAATMSGATLLGHFTLDDAPDAPPRPEAYRLGKVEKVGGDVWRFEAEIEYGGKSTRLPLNLEVHWAGDTPVITLTDMTLPMLGTFTSRVVIHGGQYAGIWSGADHGGHLFGRVVPAGEAAAPAAEDATGDTGGD